MSNILLLIYFLCKEKSLNYSGYAPCLKFDDVSILSFMFPWIVSLGPAGGVQI